MAVNENHYDVGDVWQPQFTFKVGTTNTDPTNVTFRLLLPNGATESVGPTSGGAPAGTSTHITAITRNSAGVYTLSVSLDAAGYWAAQVLGTGAATGAETQEAIVDPDLFTASAGLSSRALAGLQETKAWLAGMNQKVDTSDDMTIVSLINSASRTIHEVAGREFKAVGTNPQTRTFELDYGDTVLREVRVGDMASAPTAVTLTDMSGTVANVLTTDWVAEPRIREEWEPVTSISFPYFSTTPATLGVGYVLSVTGSWGFPAVPSDINQACKDAVAYMRDRDVEHYRQDFGAVQGAEGQPTVIVGRVGPTILSLPPELFARVSGYRETVVV